MHTGRRRRIHARSDDGSTRRSALGFGDGPKLGCELGVNDGSALGDDQGSKVACGFDSGVTLGRSGVLTMDLHWA